MTPTFYSHQKEIIERSPNKIGLWWGTGSGKSHASAGLVNKKQVTALFIVPKIVKGKWRELLDEFNSPFLKNSLVVTKEEFRRDFKKLPPFEAVVVDEMHHFASPKSQLSKALMAYNKHHAPRYFYGLTATPLTATPWSIYSLANHFGYNLNWFTFRETFFYPRQLGSNGRVVYMPREDEESREKLQNLIKALGDVLTLEDLVDVPEQLERHESLPLQPWQKKAIENIEETNFLARFTRQHMIENGVHEEGGKDPKIERIKEYCYEFPKIAIFARYNDQLDLYRRELAKEFPDRPIYLINGKVKDKESVAKEAENSEKCIILINSEASEAYELPSIPCAIFASLSFKYKDLVQGKGRFLRINKLKRNLYVYLTVENGKKGTKDQRIANIIQKKQDFYIELHAGEEFNNRIPEVV
jgi:superfamily II DNA or RNA helicase